MHSLVVLLSLLAPGVDRAPPMTHRVQAHDHNPLDCYCRGQGRIFAPGEKICLMTAEGPRLAQCEMEINVMSWRITQTPCPQA